MSILYSYVITLSFTIISTRFLAIANVGGGMSSSSSSSVCAVLNLQDSSALFTKCSPTDAAGMRKQFLTHGSDWAESKSLPVEKLVLVTGFYKTKNWEAAVLSSSQSSTQLSLTANAVGPAGGEISVDWASAQNSSYDYSTGHRHPTTPTHLQRSFSACCTVTGHNEINQCIFLRGYRIRFSMSLRGMGAMGVFTGLGESNTFKFAGSRAQSRALGANQTGTTPTGECLEPVEGNTDRSRCVSDRWVDIEPGLIDLLMI